MKCRQAETFPRLMRRRLTINLPHPSPRDRDASFWRMRTLLQQCSDFYSENHENKEANCFGVVVLPIQRPHESGRPEPVLGVFLFTLTRSAGFVGLDCLPCGRISHHAIERMYQRLRTSSHQEVFDELRTSLGWVPMLHGITSMTRRAAVLRELPVPTRRGVFRCFRDEGLGGLLEVRTFTLNGTSSRIDRSLAMLWRWHEVPRENREAEFIALLRHPDNRWWREAYRHAE